METFDTIEIPASELAKVIDTAPVEQPVVEPKKEPTEPVKKESTPEPASVETPPEPEVVKIKVKDAEYTEDEIATAIEDSKNKANWNKTNTEEAQRIAVIRKKIEPVVKFLEKLKADGEFGGELRESAIERFGEEFTETVDAVLKFDSGEVPNPFKDELTAEQEKREAAEYELFVLKEKAEFARATNLHSKKVDEVWEFAEKLHREKGEIYTLANAYKLMQFDDLKKKAETPPPPKPPKVPDVAPGAKDIKSQPAKSFEEIDITDYPLFE